jgi:hypothetical protein
MTLLTGQVQRKKSKEKQETCQVNSDQPVKLMTRVMESIGSNLFYFILLYDKKNTKNDLLLM